MGHRALIAYQEPSNMRWTTYYSQWDAVHARLFGMEWAPAGSSYRYGENVETDLPTLKAVAQTVDFLFHECVYVSTPECGMRAFDTVWWSGLYGTDDRLRSTVGFGALVELETADEWQSFSKPYYEDVEEMSARQFHEFVREKWGDRIPDWSPMGGSELRLPEWYHNKYHY